MKLEVAGKNVLQSLILFGTLLSVCSYAQSPFPEGPGRDIAIDNCAQCHSIGKIVTADLTHEEWEFLVYDMISRGSTVHADQVDVLQKYLQENFAKPDTDNRT